MRTEPAIVPTCDISLAPLAAKPPSWVEAVLADGRDACSGTGGVQICRGATLTLFSAAVVGARSMAASSLRAGVSEAYAAIADAVSQAQRSPIRFWNFVPSPGDLMGPGLDRYMVFNEGRYDAYARWYGTPRAFAHSLATASAVGVDAADLTVFCLAADGPGVPVENPRQRSSWEYSRRYGPKPPCFARATVVHLSGAPQVLIGGTASIVGEDSQHLGDLERQTRETLTNLMTLIAAARGAAVPTVADLARLTTVRVYLPRPDDANAVRSIVAELCPGLIGMEMATAQICRPELLVEIEGVAAI